MRSTYVETLIDVWEEVLHHSEVEGEGIIEEELIVMYLNAARISKLEEENAILAVEVAAVAIVIVKASAAQVHWVQPNHLFQSSRSRQ